jgi:hypothetical protein
MDVRVDAAAVTMQPSPANTSVQAPTIIGFFFLVIGSA